jgi:site-specific DNA-methyltransferase (adenine-specific)
MTQNIIYHGDNLKFLSRIKDESIDLILTDPPYGTDKKQTRTFQKNHTKQKTLGYDDSANTFLEDLKIRLLEFYRVLKPTGSLYIAQDESFVHYVKVMLDELFDRKNFKNEIICHSDYGFRFGPTKKWTSHEYRWLWYTKSDTYTCDVRNSDRLEYKAPTRQKDKTKVESGKIPTSVWYPGIIHTQSKENQTYKYPTKKPLQLIQRIVKVHSNPGDIILDPYAGAGTTGLAAGLENRYFLLCDSHPDAYEIMQDRLKDFEIIYAKIL